MFKLIVGVGGVAAYFVVLSLLSCAFGAAIALTMQHFGVAKEIANLVAATVAVAFAGGAAALSVIWAFIKSEER